MSEGSGRAFWKMSGSGNDFVFFDARAAGRRPDPLETAESIAMICAPHLGVGADGVVFIAEYADALFEIRYYNADGSRASLCGNASLCAAQSAVRLGLTQLGSTFLFATDAGIVQANVSAAGVASVRLVAVSSLEAGALETPLPTEERIGYAVVGVPHLVVLMANAEDADVAVRGRELRNGAQRAPAGANVNFVSKATNEAGERRVRTFERGVEGETLACGTGAVAVAACLSAWGLTASDAPTLLLTSSGKTLAVRLPEQGAGDWSELSGEGRIVYDGVLQALT
jgi:diaminopimelate epimerase